MYRMRSSRDSRVMRSFFSCTDHVTHVLFSEWLNESLLTKLEKNPDLMKYLSDPRFSEALAKMGTSSISASEKEDAMAKDPGFARAVQDFASIMGDQFSSLGQTKS